MTTDTVTSDDKYLTPEEIAADPYPWLDCFLCAAKMENVGFYRVKGREYPPDTWRDEFCCPKCGCVQTHTYAASWGEGPMTTMAEHIAHQHLAVEYQDMVVSPVRSRLRRSHDH